MVSSLPKVRILETCDLCGLCARACPVYVLQLKEKSLAKTIVAESTEKCLECRACEQICPKEAILADPF